MSPVKMSLQIDEEMGKKDDDHRPIDRRFRPLRNKVVPRPRRLIVAFVTIIVLYEFFKHMPTDLSPAVERYNPAMAKLRAETRVEWAGTDPAATVGKPEEKLQSPQASALKTDTKNTNHRAYDGEIIFPDLGRSMPQYKNLQEEDSRAVLFAGSSMRSVSDTLPLACQMAKQSSNFVHFILMGREGLSIQDIKQVNGIKDNECPLTWHVGRPNAAPISTDARMERSVKKGLHYIQSYIRPEVIITQGRSWEDSFFSNGVEVYARDSSTPHIALSTASVDLMWIALLDSSALRSWSKLQVEIVIQASSQSSGSLMRLVRCLDAADYLGSIPNLTIELPQRVDPQLLQFLRKSEGLRQLTGRITLRRGIQSLHMGPVEASIRTVESFYPLEPESTHLLMLSPQVELAPSFYHYIKYNILSYKHSAHAEKVSSKLIGISLELPSSKLTTDGELLTSPEMPVKDKEQFIPSFLWQAPNSNAALYFGDAWMEFHSFLSNRLSTSRSTSDSHTKLVAEKYPAFMEHLLEMIRAKGYYLLYPSFPGMSSSPIATVHNELYQAPEEFEDRSTSGSEKEEGFAPGLASAETPPSRAPTLMPLLDLFYSGLPDLGALPLLSFDGERMDAVEYRKQTEDYSQNFRIRYGGCVEDRQTKGPLADLFCLEE